MRDFIRKYVRVSVRHHKLVVAAAVVLLILAGAIASKLTIDSRLDGIVPADKPSVVAYQQVEDEFGGNDKIFVVVKSSGANGPSFIEALAKRLENDDLAQGMFYKMDTSFAQRYGYLFLPTEMYQKLEAGLTNPAEALGVLLKSMKGLETLPVESGYLNSGNLYVMMLKPGAVVIDPVGRDRYFTGLQQAIDETLASTPEFSQVEAGYTGGQTVLDYQGDMIAFDGFLSTAVLTFLIIIAIVILSFRRLGVPIATGLPLLLGTIITSAFTVIVYGTINMFSVAFAVLLLGLGIDFAIHILTRYSEERANGVGVEQALEITLHCTGAGMLTGALTTAAAFAMFAFGELTALKQMGIISGAGIMLALFSMLGVLPAIVAWADRNGEAKPFKNVEYTFFGPLTAQITRHRVKVLGAMVLVMVLLYPTVSTTRINADLRSMFPSNLPAMKWLNVLQEQFDYDPDSVSLVVNSMDELISLREKVLALSTVQQVESVLDFIPADQDYKLGVLHKLRFALSTPEAEQALSTMPPQVLEQIKALSSGVGELRPLTLADLPEAVTMNFVGKSGKFLLEVTAKGDIWDEGVRDALAQDLGKIYEHSPAGMPYLVRDVVDLIKSDVIRISLLSAAVIFAILYFAFKSVKDSLLAMVPAGGAMFLVLGLREILNYDINIMSIMILPLIIGIGVDNGVHLIHRVRRDGVEELPTVLVHIGKAVTTTSLTTLVGFGSLMFVNHPGLSSMGQTVALGMSLCLVLTVVVLPALIALATKRAEVKEPTPL